MRISTELGVGIILFLFILAVIFIAVDFNKTVKSLNAINEAAKENQMLLNENFQKSRIVQP